MIVFNFIGLAFVGIGCAVSVACWVLFGAYMGDTLQSFWIATSLGLWTTALLDLRYRFVGETPAIEPSNDAENPAPPPGVMGLIGGLFQLAWSLIWPFSGGQILFVPVWLPAPALCVAYLLGFLDAFIGRQGQ